MLLVNDETRFALFFPGLRKPEFQGFENFFLVSLKRELLRFGVVKGDVAKSLLALGPMTFCKTHSRSALGTMNDMAFCMEVQMKRLGRLPENEDELGWVGKSINEMPCNSKDRRGDFIPAYEMKKLTEKL